MWPRWKNLAVFARRVGARVNLANEKAYVEALAGNLSVVDLIRQVKASGYQAQASSSNLADEKARKQKN